MKRDIYRLTRRDISALEVARLYHERGLSQQEVAQHLHIARPTVSKLLTHAKDRGFIRTTVIDPRDNNQIMAEQLRKKYSLLGVRLAPVAGRGPMDLRHALGRSAAQLLKELVREGDIIGVAWSHTIAEMAQALTPQQVSGVRIVQLRGEAMDGTASQHIAHTYQRFAEALSAELYSMDEPAVFSTFGDKMSRSRDVWVSEVLRLGAESRIAVYSVGATDQGSILFSSPLLSPSEKEHLRQVSVGDICSRYLNEKGQVCVPELNNRTLGISLPDMRHTEQKILVAGGPEKIRAVHVAVTYGYANRLVTDVQTAQQLLKM
ncbi:sugar-binding transcriptional regulator [Rothia nasimurium]|uniref:Sugar-binding transcriptional regulator n=1 Tax=Rothia nasimurium TaxID=85336 RepID=A0A4Y9F435_9MICC|nr:sugar-binding domain-containing protein [Rothia nasimurium]MBF0808443.1 MarR family transcriptional regulator [Rothia nasimurium]TFU22055.1 sugar-binding transcriptional regulator [Rothia nasimurium]